MKKKLKLFIFSMLFFICGMCYHAYTSGYLNQSALVVADSRTSIDLPILMYHSITDDSSKVSTYTILDTEFENDLKWLSNNGYTTILPAQLIDYVEKGTALPQKPILLSFDDGYANNYALAFPLLKKYNSKAVISVIGNSVDLNSSSAYRNPQTSSLNWEEVKELENSSLVEIGNHTYNLHSITDDQKGADMLLGENFENYRQRLSEDLSLNQQKISEVTGVTPLVFAWPYGAYPSDGSGYEILKELNIKISLTSYQRMNTITQGNSDSLHGLKRFLRTPDFDISSVL